MKISYLKVNILILAQDARAQLEMVYQNGVLLRPPDEGEPSDDEPMEPLEPLELVDPK